MERNLLDLTVIDTFCLFTVNEESREGNTYKSSDMSLTKNLTLKKRTKVVVGTFFQLSGATLEILVSLSTKKNSLSGEEAREKCKLSKTMMNEDNVCTQEDQFLLEYVFFFLLEVSFGISLYHRYKQGQSRNVPSGWSEPRSCQRHLLLWISPHT